MAKKRAKVFGIPERDRQETRDIIAEHRSRKRETKRTFETAPQTGMIMALVLFRPSGFDAGLCARLFFDPARPYVWDINLIGYPAISGRGTFRLQWTNGEETIQSEKIPIIATAEQFAGYLPEKVAKLAIVDGGSMTVEHEGTERTAETGRWFVSFEYQPEWVPSFIEMSDPRLQGRALRTNVRISNAVDVFRTLASVDGPFPIHPGSMAMGWPESGGLRLGPVEARIYQEYQGGPAYAEYSWSVTPFSTFVWEGSPASLSIELRASNQDVRDGDVTITVDIQIEFGEGVSEEDFSGTLDDWVAAGIAGLPEFSYAAGRISLNLAPNEELKAFELLIPSIDDDVIESQETFLIRLRNPTASSGIVLIEQNEASVTIVDRDGPVFSIFGPAASDAPGTVEFVLSVAGVFSVGTRLSVTITDAGTFGVDDVSDWRAALAVIIEGIDGVTFDVDSGEIVFTFEAVGGAPGITIPVGLEASAAGKTFGFEISEGNINGTPVSIVADSASVSVNP